MSECRRSGRPAVRGHHRQQRLVPWLTIQFLGPRHSKWRAFAYAFPHGSIVTMTAIAALMLLPRPALAGPEGGTVVAGQAGISQAGPVTNINQSTNKAIINWQGFSVGAKETVNFYQPGASSATLNRVIGNETSVINGAINANRQVFIVNSAGVLFGKGSQVNVGGLVASTLDISNSDFMAGNYKFSGNSSASIVNQGRIRAHGGGYVALLGKTVSNEGVISARLGTVAMSSGDKITLNFEGNSLLDVTIDKGTLNALVQNKRAIRANGGQVIMTAKAADQVLSAQVNNSGIVQARSVAALRGGGTGGVRIGKIRMIAEGGTTSVSGKLDASAPKGGNGGFIETSGNHVKIADSAVITTKSAYGVSGTWLIDPTDFNIVAGSAAQTNSGIGAGTLITMLGMTNVDIETVSTGTENGDINVNAALNWTSGNNLTLTAANSVNVNAPITWTTGTLTLNANNQNINIGAALTGANLSLDAADTVNIDAANALNITTISGSANYLNINQSQTWITPPSMSGLTVFSDVNVNAPLAWSGGTLGFAPFGDVNVNAAVTWSSGALSINNFANDLNINANGSLSGPTLVLALNDVNINAPNSFNVATVKGEASFGAEYGGVFNYFNINQPQTWTTPPDLTALPVGGDINVNAPLTWSTGTLTLGGGTTFCCQPATSNINLNAALTGPALVLNAPQAINVGAVDVFNVGSISMTAGSGLNIEAAQTWTTPPAFVGVWRYQRQCGSDVRPAARSSLKAAMSPM